MPTLIKFSKMSDKKLLIKFHWPYMVGNDRMSKGMKYMDGKATVR